MFIQRVASPLKFYLLLEKTSVAAIEVPVIEEPRKPSSPVPGCLEWVYAEKPIDTVGFILLKVTIV